MPLSGYGRAQASRMCRRLRTASRARPTGESDSLAANGCARPAEHRRSSPWEGFAPPRTRRYMRLKAVIELKHSISKVAKDSGGSRRDRASSGFRRSSRGDPQPSKRSVCRLHP